MKILKIFLILILAMFLFSINLHASTSISGATAYDDIHEQVTPSGKVIPNSKDSPQRTTGSSGISGATAYDDIHEQVTPSGKVIPKAKESSTSGTEAPLMYSEIERDGEFDGVISSILGVASYICYAGAVIVVLVKGVKFMNSAPDAKAEIKKEAIAVVVGASIVFGIGGILQIIANTTFSVF